MSLMLHGIAKAATDNQRPRHWILDNEGGIWPVTLTFSEREIFESQLSLYLI